MTVRSKAQSRSPYFQEAIQLELPFALPAPEIVHEGDALANALHRLYPDQRVELTYTTGESTLLAMRTNGDGSKTLRAQGVFRDAPDDVAEAVVRIYLGRPRGAARRLLTHRIHAWHHVEAPPPPSWSPTKLRKARYHDLETLLDAVNTRWFTGDLALDVTLSPRASRRTMGRHERRAPRSLVLVNPLLDHPAVESWYLDYLLYHECLHEAEPPRAGGGRLEIHPPEFRRREREHPDFHRVREYELWLTGAGHPLLLRAWRQRRANQAKNPSATKAATAAKTTKRRAHVRTGSTKPPSP